MTKRAYGQQDKQERRGVILKAASGLFRDRHGDLPSVAEIAASAGLAKGTVYIYFRTKEAIFSALLISGWSEVITLLEGAFASTNSEPRQAIGHFLSTYVTFLNERRELLRLDALRGALERNLEPETLIEFKSSFLERLSAGGEVIEQSLGLARGRGVQLLVRTHALTVGLWQAIGADESQIKIKPGVNVLHPNFGTELSEALDEYWRGALGQ